MEAEIVQMCVRLFNGDSNACGTVSVLIQYITQIYFKHLCKLLIQYPVYVHRMQEVI